MGCSQAGKAPGFEPVILGSSPSSPAILKSISLTYNKKSSPRGGDFFLFQTMCLIHSHDDLLDDL